MGIRPEAIAIHKDGIIYKTEDQKAFYSNQEDNEKYIGYMNEYQRNAILKCKEIIHNGGIVIWDTDIDGFRISNSCKTLDIRESFIKHKKELISIFSECGLEIEIKQDLNEKEHTQLLVMGQIFDLYNY